MPFHSAMLRAVLHNCLDVYRVCMYLKGDADLHRLINFEEFISWAVSEKVRLFFVPQLHVLRQ